MVPKTLTADSRELIKLKKFVQQNPNEKIIKALLELYNAGKFETAVEQTETILEQYPESFLVWNVLGASFQRINRLDNAATAFNKVIELNPTGADGYNNLGVTVKEQGDIDGAISCFKRADSLRADNVDTICNIGSTLNLRDNDFSVDAKKNTRVAFIFTGFAKKLLGVPEETLGVQLARMGWDMVFLTNMNKDLFIMGGDKFSSYNNMITELLKVRRNYSDAAVFCSSGGGFGGIKAAIDLDVELVLGFSVFTRIDREARLIDRRGMRLWKEFDLMLPNQMDQNVANYFSKKNQLRCIIFYPSSNVGDSFQAQNLEQVTNVKLIPVKSADHMMLDTNVLPTNIIRYYTEDLYGIDYS